MACSASGVRFVGKALFMPGPSFSTPRSVRPSVPRKRFSTAQANKALPLVRRIVGDIVQAHDHALEFQAKLESLHDSKADSKAQAAVQTQLDAAMDRLQDLVHELSGVGCELKDYQTGLIDFIGRHQGRDIYLCWKLGEEKIDYWHELNAGFAGRKPISMLVESE
jgi:hypothetical protein